MGELIYYPQRGYGVFEPDETTKFLYDANYFEEFKMRSETRRGLVLNELRGDLVEKIAVMSDTDQECVDCGVGSGAFIKEMMVHHSGDFSFMGYDVARCACAWLESEGLFFDLLVKKAWLVTFWDSLEHCTMEEARTLISNVTTYAFISMPIYESGDAIIRSKHFKPGEHVLYFTERGLIRWMLDQGFQLLLRSRIEEGCGREGIGTYAFART